MLHRSSQHRLNISGIKSHVFFKDIEWDTLHTLAQPPFIPVISSLEDLTFFSATPEEEEDEEYDEEDGEEDKDFLFIGYTFTENLVQPAEQPKELEKEYLELKEKVKEYEKQTGTEQLAQARLDELEKENKMYKRELEERMATERQARLGMDILKEENKQARLEIDALKEENKQVRLELDTLKEENKQVQLEINTLKEENRQTMTCKIELENKVFCLEANKQENLTEHKQYITTLTQEIQRANNALKMEKKEHKGSVEKCQKELEELKTENKRIDTSSIGKSKIISVMWQRDRENLYNVQQSLEDSESQLAWTRREMTRLKKEIKSYQMQTFEQQIINKPEKREIIEIPYNLMDSSKFNRRRRRVGLSSSVSSLHSKDFLFNRHSVNDTKKKVLQKQIEIEKEFIASTQRTLTARLRLSHSKTEFDQELQNSIDRSNSKISLLQYKLQQEKINFK